MFLKKIELKNYKCFEHHTFSFEKNFTVIIGDNGSGKTALLDGIAKGLQILVQELAPRYQKDINDYLSNNEVRMVANKMGSKVTFEKMQNRGISLETSNELSWGIDDFAHFDIVRKYTSQIKNDISNGKKIELPIVAYYKTSRHWNTEEYTNNDLFPVDSRLMTYNDCLDISTSFKVLNEWFRRMAFIQFQRQGNVPEILAVSKAMVEIMKNAQHLNLENTEIYFSAAHNELIANVGDGQELPIRMLSDGYRNTLGMIGDIAYRMAELNPHLTTESPGIVLIDELDLHLHPKWQKHIVGDLKRIFPNCQFIVTTHSPFIIQSLESGELLKLDETPDIEHDDFNKKSIEDIAELYQDVEMPQWSIHKEKMYDAAKEYYQKLEMMNGNMTAAEKKKLREELQLISKRYASEIAFTAFLEQKRLVKEAQIK